MSPTKSPKKQHPLPKLVNFPTWKIRFTKSVKRNHDESQALDCWIDKTAEYLRLIGDMEGATRDSLYEKLYRMTRPHFSSTSERKAHETAILKLRELLPAVQITIGALQACGSQLSPNSKDGMPPFGISKLIASLEQQADYLKGALLYFDRGNMPSADALSYCLPFLIDVRGCKVSVIKALALGRLAMKAHGFSDMECFDDARKGPAGPRMRKLVREYMHVLTSILETDRKKPFDPARYLKKKDVEDLFILLQKNAEEFPPKSS